MLRFAAPIQSWLRNHRISESIAVGSMSNRDQLKVFIDWMDQFFEWLVTSHFEMPAEDERMSGSVQFQWRRLLTKLKTTAAIRRFIHLSIKTYFAQNIFLFLVLLALYFILFIFFFMFLLDSTTVDNRSEEIHFRAVSELFQGSFRAFLALNSQVLGWNTSEQFQSTFRAVSVQS